MQFIFYTVSSISAAIFKLLSPALCATGKPELSTGLIALGGGGGGEAPIEK